MALWQYFSVAVPGNSRKQTKEDKSYCGMANRRQTIRSKLCMACKCIFTTDVRQPWTNYVNNGNKHLIVGADVRSEYSNIRYLHLIIGKAQKFVSCDKYDF